MSEEREKNESAVNAEPLLIAVPAGELIAAWSELIDFHVLMKGRAEHAHEGSEAREYAEGRAKGILAVADMLEGRINGSRTK